MSIANTIFIFIAGIGVGCGLGYLRGWDKGWDDAQEAIMRNVREHWPEDDPEPAELVLFPTKEAQS